MICIAINTKWVHTGLNEKILLLYLEEVLALLAGQYFDAYLLEERHINYKRQLATVSAKPMVRILLMMHFLIKILQGTLIGVAGVLPGVSGGVLCVMFGIYETAMELLAEPVKCFKTHVPKLIPVGIGAVIGFLGVAKLLSFLLEKYPAPSLCVFVGLVAGMMPSLYKEAGEQGRGKSAYVSMAVAAIGIFGFLIWFRSMNIMIVPNFGWYFVCGLLTALSIVVPGLSTSTLLMPLGLYEPFVEGICSMDLRILIPINLGTAIPAILFAKGINRLIKSYYSVAHHAIAGIVVSSTIMIIPFESFTTSLISLILNLICIIAGFVSAQIMTGINISKD